MNTADEHSVERSLVEDPTTPALRSLVEDPTTPALRSHVVTGRDYDDLVPATPAGRAQLVEGQDEGRLDSRGELIPATPMAAGRTVEGTATDRLEGRGELLATTPTLGTERTLETGVERNREEQPAQGDRAATDRDFDALTPAVKAERSTGERGTGGGSVGGVQLADPVSLSSTGSTTSGASGEFAADIDQLSANGIRLGQIRDQAAQFKQTAERIRALGDQAFGDPNDSIGAPAKAAVDPTQQFAITVFGNLSDLIGGHGEQVTGAASVARSTDSEASDHARK